MIIYSAVQIFICFVGKTWLTQSNQIFMIWYGKELSFLSEATLFSIILHIFCLCVFVAEVFIILLYLPINVSRQIRSCKKKSCCTPPPTDKKNKTSMPCLVLCEIAFFSFPSCFIYGLYNIIDAPCSLCGKNLLCSQPVFTFPLAPEVV